MSSCGVRGAGAKPGQQREVARTCSSSRRQGQSKGSSRWNMRQIYGQAAPGRPRAVAPTMIPYSSSTAERGLMRSMSSSPFVRL